MITPREIEPLSERSADLRRLMALIAGLHAHRHGPTETANVMRRIVGDPVAAPSQSADASTFLH